MDSKKTISEIIEERKDQFIKFLEQALPKDKQTITLELKAKSPVELVMFFKVFIIPNVNKIDEVIDAMLKKTDINRSEMKNEDLVKLKSYLLIFCEFMGKIAVQF